MIAIYRNKQGFFTVQLPIPFSYYSTDHHNAVVDKTVLNSILTVFIAAMRCEAGGRTTLFFPHKLLENCL